MHASTQCEPGCCSAAAPSNLHLRLNLVLLGFPLLLLSGLLVVVRVVEVGVMLQQLLARVASSQAHLLQQLQRGQGCHQEGQRQQWWRSPPLPLQPLLAHHACLAVY